MVQKAFLRLPMANWIRRLSCTQVPVVHSPKCPNFSSPPQIRDEAIYLTFHR
jgi:hypothetical protein